MPPFLHLIAELQKLFLPMYFFFFFFTFWNSLGKLCNAGSLKTLFPEIDLEDCDSPTESLDLNSMQQKKNKKQKTPSYKTVSAAY